MSYVKKCVKYQKVKQMDRWCLSKKKLDMMRFKHNEVNFWGHHYKITWSKSDTSTLWKLWRGHNEYWNVQGVFAVTDGDIVLRPTNSNFKREGLVHYFSNLTLFQLQYLVLIIRSSKFLENIFCEQFERFGDVNINTRKCGRLLRTGNILNMNRTVGFKSRLLLYDHCSN